MPLLAMKTPAFVICSATAAVALALAAGPAGAATVVLDTFGTNNRYDNGASGLVGPGPTGVVALGFVFTAPVAAAVATLTAPLSSQAPPSDLTFTLYEWTGTGLARQVDLSPVKLSNDLPEVFVADGWVTPLTQGAQYAMVASAPTASLWWQAEGSPSVHSIFTLDEGPAQDATGWFPAVRLELSTPGPAPVPAPGALGLLLGALAGLGLVARRRRDA